ncbi:hypothetical protein LY78DRAFT_663122 [Colletotrichum sublineola]|nr:hypothetical protein LY78DRAFT_663122 [Colletotrichum sublineola]
MSKKKPNISDIRRPMEGSRANRMAKMQVFKRPFKKGSRNQIGLGLLLSVCQNLTGVNIITY